jgi:hypothetical protein
MISKVWDICSKPQIQRIGFLKIKFTSHARRRARLYGISDSAKSEMLRERPLNPGRHEIVRKMVGFIYPIKIIFLIEGNVLTVITAYPLKKGHNHESSI